MVDKAVWKIMFRRLARILVLTAAYHLWGLFLCLPSLSGPTLTHYAAVLAEALAEAAPSAETEYSSEEETL